MKTTMTKEAKRISVVAKKVWRALTPEERERWRQDGTIDFIFLVQDITRLHKYTLTDDEWNRIIHIVR